MGARSWWRGLGLPGIGRLRRIEERLERLERFSHGARATYVGNNRVLVRAVVAHHNLAFYVEADDKLVSPWFIATGTYEEPLTAFFLREVKADSRCIDAGTNFGWFSCLLARLASNGRVIGIEPDARLRELAQDNLAINGFESRAVIRHAAANADGAAMTLFRRAHRSANTSMIRYGEAFTELMREPPEQAFEVAGTTVDALADELGGLDFLKIDVEGAEPLVLRGAARTIAANPRLSIVIEWAPGTMRCAGFDVAELLRWIDAAGLRCYDIYGDAPRPISHDRLLATDYLAGVLLRR